MRRADINVGESYTVARSAKDIDLNDPLAVEVIGEPVQIPERCDDICFVNRWVVPIKRGKGDQPIHFLVYRRWAVLIPGTNDYGLLVNKFVEPVATTAARQVVFEQKKAARSAFYIEAGKLKDRLEATGLMKVNIPLRLDFESGSLRVVLTIEQAERLLALVSPQDT